MIAASSYTPSIRDGKGVQPFSRPVMSVICDVCSIPRTRGNHQRCAKIRQAAGFMRSADTLAGHTQNKAKGCKPDFNFQPAQAQLAMEKSA